MRNLILFTGMLLIYGCATYTLLTPNEPQTIKSITVTPTAVWNSVPNMYGIGGVPTWTIDGITLNTISFFSDIEDGSSIINTSDADEYPVFRADMLPNEITEIVESTVAKYFNSRITASGELNPIQIDGEIGFEYTFEFVTQDDLIRKAYTAALVKDQKLQLFLYQAARLHYYDHNLGNVRNLIQTASIL